jgi:hypothetical protein
MTRIANNAIGYDMSFVVDHEMYYGIQTRGINACKDNIQ